MTGRLIDADELLKHKSDHETISTHLIWNAPTVDAEPVRHGRWNFEGWNTFTCTHCGAVYEKEQLEGLRQYESDPIFPRYCPNCGAKMEGEK